MGLTAAGRRKRSRRTTTSSSSPSPSTTRREMAKKIGQNVRAGAPPTDITSVKRAARGHARQRRENVDVVGTHPMFGPHGIDFDRQKVVPCRARGEAAFTRVKKLFETFGAEIDRRGERRRARRQMALIQVLAREDDGFARPRAPC